MASNVIYFKGTRQDVSRTLRHLVGAMAGQGTDPWGVVYGLQMRVANTLLMLIQIAFLVKMRGGTDECGIKWPPLKRETIANRRPAPRKKKGERPRGLLTADQDRRWSKLFGQRKGMLMAKFGMGEVEASAAAARYAWAISKSEGAKTKLAVYGSRIVDILRDTGELFRALVFGVDEVSRPGPKPSGAEGQVCRVFQGAITVGSNKKPWHHFGSKRGLPKRLLWPEDGSIPQLWRNEIGEQLEYGMAKAVVSAFSQGGLR